MAIPNNITWNFKVIFLYFSRATSLYSAFNRQSAARGRIIRGKWYQHDEGTDFQKSITNVAGTDCTKLDKG